MAANVESRRQRIAEFRRTLFDELAKAEPWLPVSEHAVGKAERKAKLQTLAAPVDGTVQQLAIRTGGGVVTPAQTLLVVVPVDSHIEIEAMVHNHDIGFVHVGQDAEIKVDAFKFSRYRVLHGKVLSVSQDAIPRDKAQDSNAEQPRGQGTDSSSDRRARN